MLKNVDHIGIAVKTLGVSIPLFEKLLDTTCYKTEEVKSEMVKTAFFKTGETKMELLESANPSSAIARFIEKKGEGLHHIALKVDDIHAEIGRLKSEGFTFVDENPREGADNKLVAFLHPKSTNGVLVELVMDKD